MNSGQVISRILKEKGITQRWLANQLNISNARMSLMLQKDLKVGILLEMCEILDIKVEDIVNATNQKDTLKGG